MNNFINCSWSKENLDEDDRLLKALVTCTGCGNMITDCEFETLHRQGNK